MDTVPISIATLLFAQADPPAAAPDPFGGMLIPLALTLIVAYFLLVLPEKRKQADLKKKLGGIKKNDRVVTIGGIIGTVTNASDGSEEITLRIDDNNNTRVHVLRSSISRVLQGSDEEGGEKAKSNA